jgi:hypothetical protein
LADNLGKNYINVREYRRGNHKRTIQRNWQQRRRKTKQKHNTIYIKIPAHSYKQLGVKTGNIGYNGRIKTKHNMCWTPLFIKQTQIT